MTTLSWDGRYLAADTRISTPSERRNDSAKIHVFKEDILIDGSRAVAAATSGNAALSRQVITAIKNNPEHAERIGSIFQDAWKYGLESDERTCTLLIVCEDCIKLFAIRYKSGKRTTSLRSFPITEKMAAGSGGTMALFAMRHCHSSAPWAVGMAAMVDEATGSFVQYYAIQGKKVGARQEQHYRSHDKILQRVVKGIQSREDVPCSGTTPKRKSPSKRKSAKA